MQSIKYIYAIVLEMYRVYLVNSRKHFGYVYTKHLSTKNIIYNLPGAVIMSVFVQYMQT